MLSKKIMDVQDNELNILDEDSDEEDLRKRYMKRDKNMDIIVPLKGNFKVPNYLIDFIENDPDFVPEVHSNNLEDAFISINNELQSQGKDARKDSNSSNGGTSENTNNRIGITGVANKNTFGLTDNIQKNKVKKRLPFANQYVIMLKLRLNYLWHQKGILATLVIISLLMFVAMYIAF